MVKDMIKTTQKVVPMIYAYTTPEIERHNGWTKIGYTEQGVEKRMGQQTHTSDVQYKEEWRGNAIFDDGTGDLFTDHDFHAYLRKLGIENMKRTEWFKVDGDTSFLHFSKFRRDRGIIKNLGIIPYTLRNEQDEAVSQTVNHYNNGGKQFLWNAKPRFGKTLSVYDFCKRIGAVSVLIVTNRPAIANSWYSDYATFLGTESGYLFVSEVDGIKDKPLVLSREQYIDRLNMIGGDDIKFIEFVSLQDLKGSVYFGGQHNKLRELSDKYGITWDVLVIDEAHEGVDTYKTNVAFDHIKRKYSLHLSGTPFKALANEKFKENEIYNWTYADEQKAKRDWDDSDESNPYEKLPQLNLFTYQMSEIIKDQIKQGVEIDGETEEYAFDLGLFFAVKGGKFVYDDAVNKFLDTLATNEKYPFSTPELRDELKHTFWILNRVDAAKALAEKLKVHPVFHEYDIVLAAGDGKLEEDEERAKSFDKVTDSIAKHDKTITLSVGQLTTGVTIPEWTAVLMLSNMHSPALYMQAAFRAQNPCLFQKEGQYYRKENSYVFDFDPARTLTIFEEFANDLSTETSNGKGDTETRKLRVKELLNFFPVIGEDEDGKMTLLDAEKVLTIPRKIRSQEVVKRGFMSNYLFQNIGNIFNAPAVVATILDKLQAVEEAKEVGVHKVSTDNFTIDEEGKVAIKEEYVIGQAQNVFGDTIWADLEVNDSPAIDIIIEKPQPTKQAEIEIFEHFKDQLKKTLIDPMMEKTSEAYGEDMRVSDKKELERKLNSSADSMIRKVTTEFIIESKTQEEEKKQALIDRFNTGKSQAEIEAEYAKKHQEAVQKLKDSIEQGKKEFVESQTEQIVTTMETKKTQREVNSIEEGIRDHLRGFARTIPSFLMAYGDDNTTLDSFDTIIPDEVFLEVTSITLDEFRFLRDGGDYKDEITGEDKHFDGNLFDPVVFDDSIKEFMKLRIKLADYFDESSTEDIFDYIPPQKTNQIYTPKNVVKNMVDMLEEENPGCFDRDDKTFIDLYMKSGLYITEIVKRLYQSEKMKQLHPDKAERLRHIFEKQVYGLAPTEIIYRIATNFILGFSDEIAITKHNFKQVDSLPYAKEGTLEKKLDEIFGK